MVNYVVGMWYAVSLFTLQWWYVVGVVYSRALYVVWHGMWYGMECGMPCFVLCCLILSPSCHPAQPICGMAWYMVWGMLSHRLAPQPVDPTV